MSELFEDFLMTQRLDKLNSWESEAEASQPIWWGK
jgi:hypothetical protein